MGDLDIYFFLLNSVSLIIFLELTTSWWKTISIYFYMQTKHDYHHLVQKKDTQL